MKKLSKHQTFKLIKKFSGGDRDTFDELCMIYRPYVFRVALKYLRSKEDAEDLVQEVFIKLYENLENFKFKSDFKTYLYRITVNSAFNYYKKEKKHKAGKDTIPGDIISQNKNTDEEIIEKETIAEVGKAVLGLPENHKTVIILKDFHNLTYKQIIKKLKITENAARISRHYALKKLKKLLFSSINPLCF